MRVVDENGRELRAEASIGVFHAMDGIYLHSRGGTKGSKNERNVDYTTALTCIISRLIALDHKEVHAWVASSRLEDSPPEAAKITLDGHDFIPIAHASAPVDIQRQVSRRMSAIGQDAGAKGGNPTKRIFIMASAEECQTLIVGRNLAPCISSDEVDELDAPDLSSDLRSVAVRAIKMRRGQQRFRAKLLFAYGEACALSGCQVVEVLEAAHISPYLGDHTNVVTNGILLRADLHTLFDLNRLHISQDYVISVVDELLSTEYGRLHGTCRSEGPSGARRIAKQTSPIRHRPLCNTENLRKRIMSFAPVRRNQLIAPFGPGALVVLPDGGSSVIVGSIDQWFRSTGSDRPLMDHPFGGYQDRGREQFDAREFMIDEWRLAKHLKVDNLMTPPDHRPTHRSQVTKNTGLTVPAYRFPQWHVCSDSRCRQMTRLPLTCIKPPKCPSCGAGRLVQVRFIVLCPRGHIQDFPWNQWLHGSANPTCPGRLVYSESGMGGTMGISVSCKLCDVKPRSLAGADSILERGNDPASFATRLSMQLDKSTPFICQGARPWTGEERPEGGCGCHLVAVQRNAGNVYFPCVTSALFVPRVGDSGYMDERTCEVHAALMPLIHMFKDLEMLPDSITGEWLWGQKKAGELCRARGWSVEDVRKAAPYMQGQAAAATGTPIQTEGTTADEDESIQLKRPEYPLLRGGCDHALLRVRAMDPTGYGPMVAGGFAAISLVESLCETRALTGFSRILPEPAGGQTGPEERRGLLHGPSWPCTWLPGCQVFGEGIFLELDPVRIASWQSSGAADLERRVGMIRRAYAAQRGDEAAKRKPLDPVFLLLHSLAHLLINRLTRECGYSTASLRERIYRTDSGTPMHGLLIYTAAGDSEGTMGGLVRMGKAGKFESVLADAIEEARWCAADPVCRELGGEGRGPDPCNIAACHNCLLVPETSCEEFNRFLDRGMVVGPVGYWA